MKRTWTLYCLITCILSGPSAYAQESRRGSREWSPSAEELKKVTARLDLPYQDAPHERQRLDLFMPLNATEPLPVIVWIHGGAWYRGSKTNCPPLREGFVDKGFAVASIDYRLSGDAVFPAQIQDCRAAMRYLRANAEELGLDPARIGVWGSSAGGHLACLLGTAADHMEWDIGSNLEHSAHVVAVCDFYGPTNLLTFVNKRDGRPNGKTPENRLLGGPIAEHEELARSASPVNFVSQEDPPFLVFHGDKDRNVDISQSKELSDKLAAAGVTCTFHTVSGAGHGSPKFYEPTVMERVEKFFLEHLGSPRSPSSDSK